MGSVASSWLPASRGNGSAADPFIVGSSPAPASPPPPPPPSRAPNKRKATVVASPPRQRHEDHIPPPAKRTKQSQETNNRLNPQQRPAPSTNPLQQANFPDYSMTRPMRNHSTHQPAPAPAPSQRKPAIDPADVRSKRHRTHPTHDYLAKRQRALTQPMFVLSRRTHLRSSRSESAPTYPTESYDLAGSTGNVYRVTIDKIPYCSCPSAAKDTQCKHIIYILSRVLKAPEDLAMQLCLTENELRRMFAAAPKPENVNAAGEDKLESGRKPIEGDCPICFCEFAPRDKSEKIIWCRAACGNNVHEHCFDAWAAQKGGKGTCPFCRSKWVRAGAGAAGKVDWKQARVGADGYLNVAGQLGLSTQRDTSTYYSWWVERERRLRQGDFYYDDDFYGGDEDEDEELDVGFDEEFDEDSDEESDDDSDEDFDEGFDEDSDEDDGDEDSDEEFDEVELELELEGDDDEW